MHIDKNPCSRHDYAMTFDDLAARFTESLIAAIKAEMGRQGLMSSRALGRAIGRSSQYISDRLDGGSSKTGKRVQLNAADISQIAHALGLTELELIERAEQEAMIRPDVALAASDDPDWQHTQEQEQEYP